MLPDVSESVRKVHRLLKTAESNLSLRKHAAAVREMKALYASLIAGAKLTQGDKTTLLATGLRLYRKGQAAGTGSAGHSSSEAKAARTSAALLFSTICHGIASDPSDPNDLRDCSAEEELVAAWLAAPPVDVRAFGEESEDSCNSAGASARDAGAVVVSCLRLAKRLCDGARSGGSHSASGHGTLSQEAFDELLHLSNTHFSAALLCVVAKSMAAVGAATPREGGYASLHIAGLSLAATAEERSVRLAAVVGAAESEAGQAILRDLLASFLLPRSVLGVRSTLCFDRDTARRASLACPEVVARAHNVATAGAAEAWENGCGEGGAGRAAALLAGLALMLKRVVGDAAGPFAGKVELDFLAPAKGRDQGTTRLRIVPETGLWVLHSLGKGAMPVVCFQGAGLEGLCTAILLMQDGLLSDKTIR